MSDDRRRARQRNEQAQLVHEVVVDLQGFCARIFGPDRRFDLVRTRANSQPAFPAYLRASAGIGYGVGLYVLTLADDCICAMIRFDAVGCHGSGYHDRFSLNDQVVIINDASGLRSLEGADTHDYPELLVGIELVAIEPLVTGAVTGKALSSDAKLSSV